MGIDWKLLIEVRERQKATAQEALARQKRVVEEHEQHMGTAHAAWQDEVSARAALWERMHRPEGGALSVAQLSQTSAWGRTLDRRIAKAAVKVEEARGRLAQQQLQLNAARRALCEAAGELTKAQQMHERQSAQVRAVRELRQDAAADDAAAQTWLIRRQH